LKKVDVGTGKDKTVAITSCCFPLNACDGAAVTTIEGISTAQGLNPVQTQLEDNNGSQVNCTI